MAGGQRDCEHPDHTPSPTEAGDHAPHPIEKPLPTAHALPAKWTDSATQPFALAFSNEEWYLLMDMDDAEELLVNLASAGYILSWDAPGLKIRPAVSF